jgi:hypothetical protein
MIDLFTINVVQHRFHKRMCEWYMACVMFSAGLIILLGTTFDLPQYEMVRKIASQHTWGSFMVILGAARIGVLAVNGALRRGSPHLRSGLSLISAVLWSFLLAGLLAFDVPLIIGAFLAWAIVFDAANSYRAAQDARKEDDAGGVSNGTIS